MTTPNLPITIAIPTYRREGVLLETLATLLALDKPAAEMLVLDQTKKHEDRTERYLAAQAANGCIRWLRLREPSIPKAMNRGLIEATHEIVLFVDDDIRPDPNLVAAHMAAHAQHTDGLVAGRVIQPWQEDMDLPVDGPFHFAATRSAIVKEFVGCNFSVKRDIAVGLGGFDENFLRVAYRFEAEFAHRYGSQGRVIYFEPQACVHHLKDVEGGTRSFGEHLTTWRPDHALGAYYYGLRTRTMGEFLLRPYRAVATRYHLRHPWRIPGTLLAELSGMLWALCLFARGPRRLGRTTGEDSA